MTTGPPNEEFEVLWDDGEFICSRVRHHPDRNSTLLVQAAAAHPTAASLVRLEHAYSLREELDASWAARPMELIDGRGKLALRTEDPGGQVLASLLGKPWDVGPFLRVAAGLASTLSGLHLRSLVHKDMKPSNVLVDVATGRAWLAGFGLTARLTREGHALGAPQAVAGTLAYMAPEQTGRMNRLVDTRSDLYSVGVTLYEMLTGTLPFKASEPMEWIHCHIARQPAAPDERVHGIPAMLSAIVLKLLSKNAEDRYQTARGLEADLRRCLSNWDAVGRTEQFPLAEHDVPDRLLISEGLYGRGREVAMLIDAFERVARDGGQSLVLVSGYSGVGKSSVVNELQEMVVRGHGLFASGKFEPYERDTPLAPIIRAFRDLVRLVLLSSDAGLQKWREDIQLALGANAQLVIDLVPDLELIIGPQKAVPDLPPQQARARFQRVLRRFVGAFARSEHPLVLFVDDLQWLDRASLDLLHNLITHDERMHLLLVGAYRHNEVGPAHPLSATLSAIRGTSVVQEVAVGPLDREDIGALISDALRQDPDHIEPLAEVVYEKTAGNPFFVIQFLHELAGEGCLAFDSLTGAWTWDLAHIRSKGYTENVFDLLAAKLDRLSVTTQEALRGLACFERGRTDALSIVQECSEGELHTLLSEATEAGLVSRDEEGYAFCHDRIREAAYALVPEDDRPGLHVRIGRLLLAKLPASDTSEKIFDIVNQLNHGVALVTLPEEQLRVAELNLIAGRRARSTSAYESALTYLAAGEAMLSEEDWEQHYDLRFSMALDRAECEFLTSELVAADERLSRLRERAIGSTDLAAVASLRMALYTTLDRTDSAVEVGLEQLRVFGIEWRAHPSDEEVRSEYYVLRQRVGERAIETLVDLPLMRDADLLALMEVLLGILPAAQFTDRKLHDLAVLRMANLSLEYGYCDGSALAFAELSMAIGPRFGEHREGYRFGHLGVALEERRDLARFRAKVYTVVGYHVLPWTHPVQAASSMMQRALDLAQETGDLLFAAFSQTHLISLRLASGAKLDDVELEAERYLQSTRRAGFGLLEHCILGQLSVIRALRGGPELDAASLEQRLRDDPRLGIAATFYWIRQLQAQFHAGDYVSALQMGARAESLQWMGSTFFDFADYHFYSGLSHARAWDSASAAARPGHHQAIARHQAQLATWAATCTETFGSRAALASAELARLEDRVLDAERLYEQAIRSGNAAGTANVEAIASELASQFYRARGFEIIAQAYFASARSCYLRWGAEAVVHRLEAYLDFGSVPPDFRPTTTTTASSEGLDLATVIKSSQTISGEILTDKLVETLMVTAVEHAGAERGLLIFERSDGARVEAEATTQLDAITVRLLGTVAEPSDLPIAVLNYVLRTQEAVILDDAAMQNPFSADSYVVEHRVRSLLCLPLVKQAVLIGVLYLENNVASHVFTPSRIELLRLLASQAAISLENARLYGDLRESQAYLAEAQRLSQTGSWAWHPGTGEISYWSEECYRVLGFDPLEPLPRFETFFQRIHPDDQAATREIFESAIRDKAGFELDYRYIHADRGIRDIHAVGHAVFDRSGELGEFVGTVIDITERKRAEQELQHLVDFVPQIIAVLSSDGTSVHFNRVGREYTGLAPGEYRSADVIGGLIHPDDIEEMRAARERGLSRNDPFEIEARMLRKDGVYRWFLFRYNPLVEQGRVKRWYATGTEIESRKQEEERVRKENVRLEERTRIAQELHDTLLQSIMGASMQLGATMDSLPPDSPVKPKLDPILQLMEQGIEEGRNAIQGLRSSDSGTSDLVLALSGVQQEIAVQPDVDFCVSVVGQQHPLRSTIQQELYRIGREALANAFCHSKAKRVECELEYTDRNLAMRIRDNGCGIDPQVLDAGREGHWGLTGMRERAMRIGGLLKISSSATAGTEIQLSIPSDVAFQLPPTDPCD